MVPLGSGSEREIEDILLTRYACYLIAQNGDPRKEEIAFAQSYFAVQTRKQEIIEDHIRLAERLKARKQLKDSEKELSRNIYERGVDESGFARIRSKGDMALFGGHTTHDDEKTPGNSGEPAACRFPSDRYHHRQESCNRDHELQCDQRRYAGRRPDHGRTCPE